MYLAHDNSSAIPAFIDAAVARHGTKERTTEPFSCILEHVRHEYSQGPRMRASTSARDGICQVTL